MRVERLEIGRDDGVFRRSRTNRLLSRVLIVGTMSCDGVLVLQESEELARDDAPSLRQSIFFKPKP